MTPNACLWLAIVLISIVIDAFLERYKVAFKIYHVLIRGEVIKR